MTEATDPYDEALSRILTQVDGFNGTDTRWSWLSGGGAHKNFLVTAADSDSKCVVKLWSREWEQVGVIPPAPVAMQNTRIAGELGIGAAVLAIVDDPLVPGARVHPRR